MKKIIILLILITIFNYQGTKALSKNTYYVGNGANESAFLLEDNLAFFTNSDDNYEGYIGSYELNDVQIIFKPTVILTEEKCAILTKEKEITPLTFTINDENIAYLENNETKIMTIAKNHDYLYKSIKDILNNYSICNTLAGIYKNDNTEIQIHEDYTMEVWTNKNDEIIGLFGTYHYKNNDLIFTSKYICQKGKCTKQTSKMKFTRKTDILENENIENNLRSTNIPGTLKKIYLAQYGEIKIKIFDENNYIKITLASLVLGISIIILVWLIKIELKDRNK